MKIVITGAAGFIGSHLAEYLTDLGYEVIGIDNYNSYYDIALKKINTEDLAKRNIKVLQADLTDPASYQQLPKDITHIFHLAAQPGISATTSFEEYLHNNIIATQQLLTFALNLPKKPFVAYISTSSVYGLDASFAEDVEVKPASNYGITKFAAEQMVLALTRRHELKGCSLRLFSVYGPRERPEKMYTKLIKCAFENIPFPLFEGSEKHSRSFTYVGDIVKGLSAIISREDQCNGEIINIGSDQENTTQQGIDTVAKVIGKEIKIKIHPPREGDQLRTKAIIDKARRILNYNPTTSFEDGIQAQVDWYKEKFVDI